MRRILVEIAALHSRLQHGRNRCTYDGLNRLSGIAYNVGATGVPATASIGFTYGIDSSCTSAHGTGCIGQLSTMTDGVGSENYTYNSLEQLSQLDKIISGSTYTTKYLYNFASQVTQLTYPSGRVVQQSVDGAGRLCEVAPSTSSCGAATSPFATAIAYNPAGQVTGFKYGNNVYAAFAYSSDRMQLTCLDYSTTNRGINCTHDSTTKFGLNYTYPSAGSNNGLLSATTDSVDNGRSTTYTHDALYRLITATTTGSTAYPKWGLSMVYDRFGNRPAQNVTAGTGVPSSCLAIDTATNHVTGTCGSNIGFSNDPNGNMTGDGFNTLSYDAENHIVSATNSSASGTYSYDGNGQRAKKVSGGTTTVTIFLGTRVLAEYNNGAASSSPTNEYIYAGGQRIASIQSGTTNYWHYDHLSPRVRTTTTGAIADQRGTYPYGETWYGPAGSPYMFTDYYRDSESGNDYAQARYNATRFGRFLSPDSIAGNIADPQSLNRYSYVYNMPAMLADPSGLKPCYTAENRNDSSSSEEDSNGGPSASWLFVRPGHSPRQLWAALLLHPGWLRRWRR